MDDIYSTRDKQIAPFLLVQKNVRFLGSRLENTVLYFQFSPFKLCQSLVNDFASRRAPLVQPKDLLDAVETYRDMVFEMKEKRRIYEL
jgi:hypothetical protein